MCKLNYSNSKLKKCKEKIQKTYKKIPSLFKRNNTLSQRYNFHKRKKTLLNTSDFKRKEQIMRNPKMNGKVFHIKKRHIQIILSVHPLIKLNKTPLKAINQEHHNNLNPIFMINGWITLKESHNFRMKALTKLPETRKIRIIFKIKIASINNKTNK